VQATLSKKEACPSWNKTLDSRQQSPKLNRLRRRRSTSSEHRCRRDAGLASRWRVGVPASDLHENGGHGTNRLRCKGSNKSELLPVRRRPRLASGRLPSGARGRGLAKRRRGEWRSGIDGDEATGDRWRRSDRGSSDSGGEEARAEIFAHEINRLNAHNFQLFLDLYGRIAQIQIEAHEIAQTEAS
jgi:hypothetical protein